MERLSEFRRFTEADNGPEARDLREKPVEALFADFYAARSGGGSPDEGDIALLRYAAELLRNSSAGPDGRAVEARLADKVLAYVEKEDC